MTSPSSDWDEKTPTVGFVPRLRAVEARADVQEFTISEVGADVKKLRSEVAESRMAHASALRDFRIDMDRALRRMAEAIDGIAARADGAYRKAETSSNDLSAFGRELEKAKKHMKWPTAIVCVALIVAYVVLARFDAVPNEVKQLVGAAAIVGAAAMPALVPSLVDWVRARIGLAPATKPPTGGVS